jgi:SPP1 family predicted phage head-tail adaptor
MQKFKYRPRLNNGNLRHHITFQVQTETQNDYGEEIKDWVEIVAVWASINPISGKEFFAAEKLNSEVSHKINLRYTPGITSDMRIRFGERYFHIISVINFQEKNIELQLLCKELI